MRAVPEDSRTGGARPQAFQRYAADGGERPVARAVAIERPLALEFNGIGYAVMMATPLEIEDFVTGFALSEGLIAHAGQIDAVDLHAAPAGDIVRVSLDPACAEPLIERARHRVSESSCGLCGIENLEQAMRPLPRVSARCAAGPAEIFAALHRLREHQPLNSETGAVHAAAWCDGDGRVRVVREDVGRHNAFDKLIGAMARAGDDWAGGFALLSSRCSYELVEKAVRANCPLLVTISAPTDLAMARARDHGLRLAVLARPDALLEMEA